MFRRLEDTLPPDAHYSANLEELRHFVDKNGVIRNTDAPEHTFDFYHTNNERHNEVRSEAMRICQRKEVMKRLSALGLRELYLPTLSNNKPKGPHISIIAPAADILKTRKRVVVVITDRTYQDLGILSYSELRRDRGLNGATVIGFAKELAARSRGEVGSDLRERLAQDGAGIDNDEQTPGLIVLNTGQLLYSHKYNKNMSQASWDALPRKSIVHDPVRVHPIENYVKGHRTPEEHVKTVLETVIMNANFVSPGAEVYVVALEDGVNYLADALHQDFQRYAKCITALAMIHTNLSSIHIKDPQFKAFLHKRGRHWENFTSRGAEPDQCVALPPDYSATAFLNKSCDVVVDWLEVTSEAVIPRKLPDFITDVHTISVGASNEISSADDNKEWSTPDPICPCFGGGITWLGEGIFTQPAVQTAILKFFEDVAQEPQTYTNPLFQLSTHPVADFQEPEPEYEATPAIDPELQRTLSAARERLKWLYSSLAAIPTNNPTLLPGLQRVQGLITTKEASILELEEKIEKAKIEAEEAASKKIEAVKAKAEDMKGEGVVLGEVEEPLTTSDSDAENAKRDGVVPDEVAELEETETTDEKGKQKENGNVKLECEEQSGLVGFAGVGVESELLEKAKLEVVVEEVAGLVLDEKESSE